ncbi:MAG: DUF2461 domain-containing protein [Ginsengibacter sp.]
MFQSKTVTFLKELKKNNNKPWFDNNKEKYLATKIDFEHFVQQLIKGISAFDSDIKSLEVKNCTFRINRDIRFSKDKTPYKTGMGASFNNGGKKSKFAGYYFHLEPGGKSFAGGGLWMPTPPDLQKMRQEIDYCLPEFKKIIFAPSFEKQYPGGLETNPNQMLVNVPKGYDKENPAAAFLKLKNFVATRPIADKLLTTPALEKEVIHAFKGLLSLVKFINQSLE